MSPQNLPPSCAGCGSLERHRIVQQLWKTIDRALVQDKKFARVGDEKYPAPDEAKSVEVLRINKQPVGGKELDIVLVPLWLHHAPDDLAWLTAVMNRLSPRGYVVLLLTGGLTRFQTKKRAGTTAPYCDYGMDSARRFQAGLKKPALQVAGRDACTDTEELVVILANDPAVIEGLKFDLTSSHFVPLDEHGIAPSELAEAQAIKIEANLPCAICGSEDREFYGARGYRFLSYPGAMVMRRCLGCGLVFNSPRLPDDGIAKLYGANYYFFHRHDHVEFQRVMEIYRRTVALCQPRTKQLLEIGSAKGYLLAVMKSLGWDVMGVEISREAADFASRELDVKTFAGTIEQFVAESRTSVAKFPLVLAVDLIEHVLNPVQFVECCRELLEDDGLLVIDTPNADSYSTQQLGMGAQAFNPFHLFVFTPQNLAQMLRQSGFEIVSLFTYSNRGDMQALADAGLTIRTTGSLHKMSEQAAEFLRKALPYSASPDAATETAIANKGLNIVAIARKSQAAS